MIFVGRFFGRWRETSGGPLRNTLTPIEGGRGNDRLERSTQTNMNARILYCTAALAAGISLAAPSYTLPALAEITKMVGGAPMYPSKNIIENAVNSKDNTTLVAAVKAAGLVDTLEGAGPFTVFAPTNAAFAQLPAGTVDTLLKPENKGQLTGVLTYHVLPGRLTTRDLAEAIKQGGGQATFKTVQGEP